MRKLFAGFRVRPQAHLFILLGLLALCIVTALVINLYLGQEVIYTHLFYLPIILGGVWYHKKALWVAAGLGITHILLNYFILGGIQLSTMLRSLIFLLVAYVVGELSRGKDLFSRDLLRSRDKLQRREQELQALVDNTPDTVARLDRSHRFIYVNPAIEKETGIPRDRFAGRTNEEMRLRQGKMDLWNHALDTVFKTGREMTLNYDYDAPGGRKYYHARLVPEVGPGGQVDTILTISRDITGWKAAEAALQREKEKNSWLHLRSLPEILPVTPGLELDALYLPARELKGDIYQVIKRDNSLLVMLAETQDNCSYGVMVSNFVKKALQDYLNNILPKGSTLSPGAALDYLWKQYRCEAFSRECRLSVFLGLIDLPRGEMCFAAREFHRGLLAALPEGVLLELEGGWEFPSQVEESTLAEKAAGLEETPGMSETRQEKSVKVAPGTTILLTTDGLLRPVASDNGHYRARLKEVFFQHTNLPPEMVAKSIKKDFREFIGSDRGEDDLAFLVLQATRGEQRLDLELESDLSMVNQVREQLEVFISNRGEVQNQLLDFHELLVNAIEHGNKQDAAKKVQVNALVTDSYYKIVITDQGEGFNWRERVDREMDPENFFERGRGIIMSRMMSDYISYNRKGNRVTMINLLS